MRFGALAGLVCLGLALAGCGGGSESAGAPRLAAAGGVLPSAQEFDYSALNGYYLCTYSGTTVEIGVQATFSPTDVKVDFSVPAVSGPTIVASNTYRDQIGLVNGLPYYSDYLELTANAETFFFLDGNLTIVEGPVADIPNLMLQRPNSVTSCRKAQPAS